MLKLGVARSELCRELQVSDKTLRNILAGQPVGYWVFRRNLTLFQRILREHEIQDPLELHALLEPKSSAAEDLNPPKHV